MVALPETESLWYMGQSKQHRHLLRCNSRKRRMKRSGFRKRKSRKLRLLPRHPVITSFLWFKWERIRPYFNRNLRIYTLFVFLLTWLDGLSPASC